MSSLHLETVNLSGGPGSIAARVSPGRERTPRGPKHAARSGACFMETPGGFRARAAGIATIPLAAALVLACTTSLAGQGTVGLRFGATDGTVSAGRLDGLDQIPRRSFSLEGSVTLSLREHFGLRLGLALTGKGTTYGLGSVLVAEDLRGTLTYERTYVELRALGRAMLPLWNRHVSLYALAGPGLAFSRKCDVSWHAITGPSTSRSTYFDQCELPLGPDSQIRLNGGSDFGFIGGLGVDFSFWDMGLSAEVLYTFGLGSDGTGDTVRNRVRTVQFGVWVPFG